MHKELVLTFTFMFVKSSNVMTLSKKTPTFDKFVWFGFWDKGERESENVKT